MDLYNYFPYSFSSSNNNNSGKYDYARTHSSNTYTLGFAAKSM